MTQDKQEPKVADGKTKTMKEDLSKMIYDNGNMYKTVADKIADAIVKSGGYVPFKELAALQQRVKELEEERDNWAKEAGRRSAKDIEYINKIEAEKAHLKTEKEEIRLIGVKYANKAIELEKKNAALESQLKPVSGWEETVLKDYPDDFITQSASGVVFYHPDVLLKAQAELTWRKALASQQSKGGTK